MILNRLTLCNFRAYAGVHHVDLIPRVKYGATRPIVLVGGLNGTGKTTLLMAVKLALYGRHAIGVGTTKVRYNQFIQDCIHSPLEAAVRPDSAFVELDFTYGKLGRRHHYIVRRKWQAIGQEVQETLTLQQEGDASGALSTADCQGFLNELVPLGVSALFFFDGEKVTSLAEDDTGGALGEALRRLLGLDLIERLRSDLRVYVLRGKARAGDETAGEQIEDLRRRYEECRGELAKRRDALIAAKAGLDELVAERDLLELRLAERGGDLAQSRHAREAEATRVADALRGDERDLQTELAGVYPLALASDVLRGALQASTADLASFRARAENQLLFKFASALKSNLDKNTHMSIDCALEKMVHPESDESKGDTIPDLSERALGRMERLLQYELPTAEDRVRTIVETLTERQSELKRIMLRIERTPDEASLTAEFSALASLNDRIISAGTDVAVRTRELKVGYSNAIQLARSLRDQHNARSKREELDDPLRLAAGARVLLKSFQEISARRKVELLEREFVIAFRRLMEKDIVADARIDARQFTVTLLNGEGGEVQRSQLSAGEKQIYAIAMLEALARISERQLPVIIDTPLGRLDSRHRTNLVERYFPHASHQVILLSTDTELDSSFYRSLSRHVSHAYVIHHGESGANLREGYFWREGQREVK